MNLAKAHHLVTMKIAIYSDLHWEIDRSAERVKFDVGDADVVVLAGDIDNGRYAIESARKAYPDSRIVQIAGNHEFYYGDIDELFESMRADAQKHDVHFLEQDSVVIDGVRFVGCTLWTDFAIAAPNGDVDLALEFGQNGLNDVHVTSKGFRKSDWTARDSRDKHIESVKWLRSELNKDHGGPTVVVTHHGVGRGSVHPRFYDGPLNGAFSSNLYPLMDQFGPELWIHGHTHEAVDYQRGRTRVVANPLGYPDEDRVTEFDPDLRVEVVTSV